MEESYKLVEIIIDTITNDWMPIINKFFNSTITFFSDYGIFVLIGVIIYLYWTYWYWRHARAAVENIYIAPVSVKGGIAEQLGSRETGLILWSQLTQIAEVFSEERRGHASLYMAAVLGDRFRGMGQVLNLGNESYRINKEELEKSVLLEEFSINVGSIKIPIGAIINFFLAIFRVIPVFFRKKYYSCLINVTVISVKNETQLIVTRKGWRSTDKQNEHSKYVINNEIQNNKVDAQSDTHPKDNYQRNNSDSISLRKECNGILTLTKKVENLTEFNDLLRDAAFMVLQLHDKVFKGIKARSMRYFTDGILKLDEFRRTGTGENMDDAEYMFSLATDYDTNNAEALYYYSSPLLIKRKPESIKGAIKFLEKVLKISNLKSKNEVLWGLANASLAVCYSQKIHRLAECHLREQEFANKYLEDAKSVLEKQTSKYLKSWILYVSAMVMHADEGTDRNRKKIIIPKFKEAAELYRKAIENEPDNGTLYNNLGWVLLKLTEWKVENINELFNKPNNFSGNISKLAEEYLSQSLVFNPNNKLTHANLCLLYANPTFRSDPNKYFDKCRFHGRKAVQIDPDYINGYRDLTVSLIRYKKLEEAYEYYKKALELSAEIEKDQEIIHDAIEALKEIEKEMKISEKLWKDWQSPDPDLLLPPEKKNST